MNTPQISNLSRFSSWFLLLFVLFTGTQKVNAQEPFLKNIYDTNYICSYTEELTARTFSSISFASISFQDQELDKDLKYGINSKLSFGLGFNYSVIGINLGVSPLGNSVSNEKYGKTKSFDFRMNLYGRKIIFDLYFMTHSGFYLSNPESILADWPDESEVYPLRPDIELFSTGIVAQYIFNNKKFSMRATFVQNEWQKKSAGSFLVGGEFFYSHFKGDSSFIPSQVDPPEFLGGYHFDNSLSINLGANVGYSHTFVVKRHWFLAIGLSAGPQLSYSVIQEYGNNLSKKKDITFGVNAGLRTGFGYNSRKFYVGVFFINQNLYHNLSISKASSLFSTGIFKLNLAYRFTLRKPIKFLNPNYWKFLQPKENEQ